MTFHFWSLVLNTSYTISFMLFTFGMGVKKLGKFMRIKMGRKANKVSKETEQYILDNLKYDPDTGHLWWTQRGGPSRSIDSPAGHRHKNGYIEVNLRYGGKQHRVMAHRIAWFLHYGKWPKDFIDHINMVKDDNRICNIREATHSQNMANIPKLITNSQTNSRHGYSHKTYVGVYRIPSGRWVARCVRKYLGSYDTPEEAALAYNREAERKFGEYAQLNILT